MGFWAVKRKRPRRADEWMTNVRPGAQYRPKKMIEQEMEIHTFQSVA